MKKMPDTFSIDIACLQISPFKAVILQSFWAIPLKIKHRQIYKRMKEVAWHKVWY